MNVKNLSTKQVAATPFKCPACNDVFDRFSSDSGSNKVGTGTVALCTGCGCISIYNANSKTLVRATKPVLELVVNKGLIGPKEMDMIIRGSSRIKYLKSKGETVNIPALAQWLNSHNN